ncbi:hypothetical protein [Deferribacter autotrophicus]|uniref:hypothetical protein n=1 Tax=Deferribacter autotrophicus TaxID=500465 RepID=UPI00165E593F|nr:hypothetical protein [Deferribacter autotrophicus]
MERLERVSKEANDYIDYKNKYSLEAIEKIDFFIGLHKELEEHIENNQGDLKAVLDQ